MFFAALYALARLIQMVCLGPFWSVPYRTWRQIVRRRWPRPIVALLAAPGACACALLALGAAQAWPLATIGEGARLGLRAYSPIHRLLDQVAQLSLLVQMTPPLDAVLAALTGWAIVALVTTVFLSPVYLALAINAKAS